MAAPIDRLESLVPPGPPWVRLEPVASWVRLDPVRFQHALLDGCWWPGTNDLEVELCVLVPVLDRFRGPVVKLLLSAARWTTRPHDVVAAGRTVGVAYLAGQSPAMITVLCAGGGSFTMRVAASDPAPDVPDGPERDLDEDAWRNADGAFRPLRGRAIR